MTITLKQQTHENTNQETEPIPFCRNFNAVNIDCQGMLVIFLSVVLQQHVINTHKLLDINKMF
jgi:hypothetical protein